MFNPRRRHRAGLCDALPARLALRDPLRPAWPGVRCSSTPGMGDRLQQQPWQFAVCWGAGISCRANAFGTCASAAGLELKSLAVQHTCKSCRVSMGGQKGDPLGVSSRNCDSVMGLNCLDDGCVLCAL